MEDFDALLARASDPQLSDAQKLVELIKLEERVLDPDVTRDAAFTYYNAVANLNASIAARIAETRVVIAAMCLLAVLAVTLVALAAWARTRMRERASAEARSRVEAAAARADAQRAQDDLRRPQTEIVDPRALWEQFRFTVLRTSAQDPEALMEQIGLRINHHDIAGSSVALEAVSTMLLRDAGTTDETRRGNAAKLDAASVLIEEILLGRSGIEEDTSVLKKAIHDVVVAAEMRLDEDVCLGAAPSEAPAAPSEAPAAPAAQAAQAAPAPPTPAGHPVGSKIPMRPSLQPRTAPTRRQAQAARLA